MNTTVTEDSINQCAALFFTEALLITKIGINFLIITLS